MGTARPVRSGDVLAFALWWRLAHVPAGRHRLGIGNGGNDMKIETIYGVCMQPRVAKMPIVSLLMQF
ncbi:hypothetical protein GCM10011320_01110 [Neoroseomonas lacus]|uniref:Uncharacterized protein n=1 Tax=Neoroseomonas lacus TaxID=287609 RepID=A0A917K2A6_9PROT|nr:hypothetical protein GCM10011320_01110 [Neoroseomonas lacus]